MPYQTQKLIAPKTKFRKRYHEVNRDVYISMGNGLANVGPDAFLDTTYNCPLEQDHETNPNGSADPGESIEMYSVVDPKISGADKVTGSATSNPAEQQQSSSFDSATEVSVSSQSSVSSQATSLYTSTQGCDAPVASMVDNPGFSGAPSIVSNSLATIPSLPISRQLKRSYSIAAIGKMHRGRRLNGKYDPENHEIMRLRQEEDLDFQEIASKLNEERRMDGGKDDLTDNAVYSRYTRNAPLIAQMRNEKFEPTAKDNQYTKMKFPKVQPITGFNPHEDMLLDVATQQIQQQFWALVSKRVEELGGGYHDPETCERRFDCL